LFGYDGVNRVSTVTFINKPLGRPIVNISSFN
jgi:hypothetical protein